MARLTDVKRKELERRIPGWGADADAKRRPGVPRIAPGVLDVPKKGPPLRQRGWRSVVHPPDSPPTPVFGTSVPLKRFAPSGWIKRLAYSIPQDKGEHWVLLALGDRLDFVESRLAPLALGASLAGAGLFVWKALTAPATKPARRGTRRIPAYLPRNVGARSRPTDGAWAPL